jgi:hypothetical protein
MKKRTKALLFVLAAGLIFQGHAIASAGFFGRQGTQKGVSERELADRLLDKIIGSYTRFTMPVFMDLVSEDYMPDRMELTNLAGESYYREVVVQLDYFMNKVMLRGDLLAVTFRWQKMSQSRTTGGMVKQEGNATFVFRKYGDEWLLVRIRGNNPLL